MKKLFGIFIIAVCLTLPAQAQLTIERQVVSSTGASLSAGNLSMDITVGEAIIQTLSAGNLVLTQGFQQGELNPNVGIDYVQDLQVGYLVYPNPTNRNLTIRLDTDEMISLRTSVCDMHGRDLGIIHHFHGKGRMEHQLSLEALAAGMYVLHIHNKNGLILKSIKVQKLE